MQKPHVNTHTRRPVASARRAPQGAGAALQHSHPVMPEKSSGTPKQEGPLNTGDKFAGLGKMPERSR